jgi:ABC-type polysaccharide/polyol phosphate transport system ATPase subunit
MSNEEIIIKIRNVNKTFKVKDRGNYSIRGKIFSIFKIQKSRKIEALKNINIEIKKGEIFGVIGKNGSGKTTLLKLMGKVYPPDKGGFVEINGDYQRLTLGTGFDPELTARENIYLNASLFGLTFKIIGQVFQDIIDFADLNEFVDTKIKYYSSGMVSRLAFAIAVNVKADIFFVDEFFGGVGDIGFKQKSEKVFRESILQDRTIIYVSHNLESIKEYCDRVLLLDKGVIIKVGKPDEVLEVYKGLK